MKNDPVSEFRAAMLSEGLEFLAVMVPGKLHRFPGTGKPKGNMAGWCIMFTDRLGGCFGDWSRGFSGQWLAKREQPFTAEERAEFVHHVAQARALAELEREKKQAEAATKAGQLWEAASPAPDAHPYLTRKGITASGAKIHQDELVLPLRQKGKIQSLQFIDERGKKRFMPDGRVSGCYFSMGSVAGAEALCITEGFATGATVHSATHFPVAVAFNAGNLEAVAKGLREKFPELTLVICADDDISTEGNPGVQTASAAAKAVDGKLAIPDFGAERSEGDSDFNDMAALFGNEAVSELINGQLSKLGNDGELSTAQISTDAPWPEIQPWSHQTEPEPEPYPLDALPPTVQAAVEEVTGFVKAPIPLVASSAIGALSLAIQLHVDVKRAEGLVGPTGIFALTIADSGERKSTCDGYFITAIRTYEAEQREAARPAAREYRADLDTWEAKRSGIKEKIRQLAKNDKSTESVERAMRVLEQEKPEPPKVPRFLYSDVTPEALAYGLAKQWPSGGVISAEAGIVFGSHGMGKESVMRNLSQLNVLWDGRELTIDRRSTESFTVNGARLTIGLQVQRATLRDFLTRNGELARGMGFLARFLLAFPESTQGSRPFSEPPSNWPALAAFDRRVSAILNQPAPINEDGVLTPSLLTLAPEAKALWVSFHDDIESQLSSSGDLYDVRDVASKSADNAVRLAALFHTFEDAGPVISAEALERGVRIAAWHLAEAQRFFGDIALPLGLVDALQLEKWLLDYCIKTGTTVISRREIQRNITPVHLRKKVALDDALLQLREANRVRLIETEGRKEVHINPELLKAVTP